MTTDEELAERFAGVTRAWAQQRPQAWRLHDCGTITCVMPFLFTWAIVVGVEADHYEYRYCYSSLAEAKAAFREFEDHTKDPVGPWIKRKGLGGDQIGPGSADLEKQRMAGSDLSAALDDLPKEVGHHNCAVVAELINHDQGIS